MSNDASAVDPETQPHLTPRQFFAISGWIYRTLYTLAPRDTILISLLTVISAAIPTATAFLTAKVIDEVLTLAKEGFTGLSEISFTDTLSITLVATFALLAVERWISVVTNYLESKFQNYYLQVYENNVIEKISSFDVQQFEDPRVWDLIRKGRDNIYKLRYFWNVSLGLLTRVVSLVISASIIFSLSPEISLLITVLSIPTNIISSKFIRKLWEFYNSNIERRRTLWSLRSDAISESKIFEHKITRSNKYIGKLLDALNNSLLLRELNIYFSRFKSTLAVEALVIVGDITYTLFLIGKILSGTITIGSFTFYQSRFSAFSSDINYISTQILTLSDSAFYAIFVKELMETEPVIKNGTTVITKEIPPTIKFKNVSFKYPNSDNYALKDINLTIHPGEEIAIVGENGSGKTTLIKLILRFYDTTEGEILINNIPIQNVELQSYYDTIGALFQEYAIYGSQSITQNIHIGDFDKTLTMDTVQEAAKKADAHEFISKLEHGYDQVLTKLFSNGINLSTGQKQKIALARMFYRDRPILILDEPTASIDAEAEYKIFRKIYEFTEKKTVIIISHRFSTVRNADIIYVLKDGKITESGSHDELLKKNGSYAHAFKLQAEGYQTKTA